MPRIYRLNHQDTKAWCLGGEKHPIDVRQAVLTFFFIRRRLPLDSLQLILQTPDQPRPRRVPPGALGAGLAQQNQLPQLNAELFLPIDQILLTHMEPPRTLDSTIQSPQMLPLPLYSENAGSALRAEHLHASYLNSLAVSSRDVRRRRCRARRLQV